MYQLIEQLMMAQEMIAGQSLPHEFNQAVVSKLDETSTDSLQRALNDLEDESINPLQKMMALQTITAVSKHAEDLKCFNEIAHKWLDNDTYEAGVDENGGIVLWDKENPESRIAMAPPKDKSTN